MPARPLRPRTTRGAQTRPHHDIGSMTCTTIASQSGPKLPRRRGLRASEDAPWGKARSPTRCAAERGAAAKARRGKEGAASEARGSSAATASGPILLYADTFYCMQNGAQRGVRTVRGACIGAPTPSLCEARPKSKMVAKMSGHENGHRCGSTMPTAAARRGACGPEPQKRAGAKPEAPAIPSAAVPPPCARGREARTREASGGAPPLSPTCPSRIWSL